jgi:integral membrane protein (TIGR00529 family)
MLIPSIGLLVSFTLIAVLANRRQPLGIAMLTGSVVLGITLGLGPGRTLTVIGNAMVSPIARELALIMALITLLNRILQRSDLLRDMLGALAGLLRNDRLSLAAIPSLVGLLPAPGAAVIAAPLVDAMGDSLALTPARRAAINIVFRHAWFLIFPFTPSLILAAELADVSVYRLASLQLPLAAILLVVGYLCYLWGSRTTPAPASKRDARTRMLRTFLFRGSPLLLGLILPVGFRVPISSSLAIAVLLAIFLGRRHPQVRVGNLLREGIDWWLVLAMAAVIAFRDVLAETAVVTVLVDGLVDGGLPVMAMAAGLPFLIGFVSASQTASIGITFPLLLPLVAPEAGPAVAVLVFTSSFLAYLISPLHLCQVLTVEYFKVRLSSVYREYLVPLAALALSLILLTWLRLA